MTTGLGDRWLAGESIDGVTFGPADAVVVRAGRGAGSLGRVRLLLGPPPDPRYLVELDDGEPAVRVRQSELEQTT
ncbi:MAG: hypothetical protein ACYC2G_15515 [Gemmatimonadaceae bacterium]